MVIAADSMGSSQNVAHNVTKVFTLTNAPVVWTASGPVYVIEEVGRALETQVDEVCKNPCPMQRALTDPDLNDLRDRVGKVMREAMKRCYETALPHGLNTGTAIGPGHAFATDFLVLGYANNTPYFFELAHDGQMNWHTDARFAAVGSGGEFATVANALMAHYLEGPALPLALGKQVAYRTIETTVEVSSSGVGLPVQLAVADAGGARVLSDDEVEEVRTAVDGWKLLERDTLKAAPDAQGGAQPDTPDALPTLEG